MNEGYELMFDFIRLFLDKSSHNIFYRERVLVGEGVLFWREILIDTYCVKWLPLRMWQGKQNGKKSGINHPC